MSASEFETINSLPDPDEPNRSIGFQQNVEVRYFSVDNLGAKVVKRVKDKEYRKANMKDRICRLQDMLKSSKNEHQIKSVKNKIKMLQDRSYRVLKLNQEMEAALHANEEPPALIDYSEEHKKDVQTIINSEYLIRLESGGFARKSMLDKDVHPPPPQLHVRLWLPGGANIAG